MLDPLVVVLVVGGLVLAGVGVALAARDRVPGRAVLGSAVLLGVVVLAQAIVSVVLVLAGERPVGSLAAFLAYLVGTVLVMPAGLMWALTERDRWSGAVLALAGLTVTALVTRLWQLWTGGVQFGAPPGA